MLLINVPVNGRYVYMYMKYLIQCFIQNSIFSSECSGCSLTGIKLTGSSLSPLLFVVVTIFSCGHFLNRCKSRLLPNLIQVGGAIVKSLLFLLLSSYVIAVAASVMFFLFGAVIAVSLLHETACDGFCCSCSCCCCCCC